MNYKQGRFLGYVTGLVMGFLLGQYYPHNKPAPTKQTVNISIANKEATLVEGKPVDFFEDGSVRYRACVELTAADNKLPICMCNVSKPLEIYK